MPCHPNHRTKYIATEQRDSCTKLKNFVQLSLLTLCRLCGKLFLHRFQYLCFRHLQNTMRRFLITPLFAARKDIFGLQYSEFGLPWIEPHGEILIHIPNILAHLVDNDAV